MKTPRVMVVACVLGTLLGCAVGARAEPGGRGDEPRVEYTVRLPRPETQMVEMSMVLRGLSGDGVELCLPVWRPGRYVVLDPSGTVREVRARGEEGRDLKVVKTDKATWRVETRGASEVVVDYRVYANSLGDRTRHVDDTHAFLSPATVFLYAPALREMALEVHIDAPAGWRVATGLEADPGDERTLRAANYDVLVDSPIEVGLQDRSAFEVDGVRHEIAVWWGGKEGPDAAPGRPRYFDLERMGADFGRIVAVQRDIFGEMPYRRYVYLLHACVGASGGTEHLNSTVMQAAPARFRTEDSYRGFLSLVSHEMFHTWNVKQLRPAGLKPYDYQHEDYTDLLWVAEGTTTYYQSVVLVRAGLMKPDAYLKSLGDSIDSLRRRPGAGVQSVERASFDSWVTFGRANPDAVNSTVSFYESGALASLALDMEIRGASGGRVSLDDLMRDMYRKFPLSGPGYAREDIIAAARGLGFEAAAGFFERHIAGVEPLDFERLLACAGLRVLRGGAGEGRGPEDVRAYVGITVETRDGAAVVSGVLSDGPGYAAGVMPGDVLVALDGERVRGGSWAEQSERLRPGEAARLVLFRMDVLREITLTPGQAPPGPWKVSRVSAPSEEQKAVYRSWLGQAWPGEKGEAGGKDAATARELPESQH